jgi:hypothetical protein
MFLSWSAYESGYGQNQANIAENNWFGAQNPSNAAGLWDGTTVPCNRNGNPIATNSKNACFASNLTWGGELNAVLNTPSSKTGITYLSALEVTLISGLGGSGDVGALQAIATNGWNGSSSYATNVFSATDLMSVIPCMLSGGLK